MGITLLPTELLLDGVVPEEVQQVWVDLGELFESQELQHARGAALEFQLPQKLLFGERGGPQLHLVLLQHLVHRGPGELGEEFLLHHVDGDEDGTRPQHGRKGALAGEGESLQLSQKLAEERCCVLERQPDLLAFRGLLRLRDAAGIRLAGC